MLKQLKITVPIFSSFAILSFLSCNLAVCAFYCLIFISEVRTKKYIDFATIFFLSLLFDAYTSRFIGISIIPLASFFAASNQLRSILPNAPIIIQIYCFFMLSCICELFHSMLIFLMTMDLNLTERISQILLATFIMSTFYVADIIFLRIRNKYAR
jgi:cell shape-determining protein MreD